MSLLDTLKGFSPEDDSLWTDDGLPSIDAVKAATGDKKVTRDAINKAALGLTRTNVAEYVAPPEANVAEEVVAQPTVTVEEAPVALEGVAALLAEIEAVRATIAAKQATASDIAKEVAALTVQLNVLELKIPVRELYLENERKNIEGFAARSEKETQERLANIAKLEASGLSVEQIMELVPKQQVLNYARII
jgi:hypothetical protein